LLARSSMSCGTSRQSCCCSSESSMGTNVAKIFS
jgi:hypothetical protein